MCYIKHVLKPVRLSRLQSVREQNQMGDFIGSDATVSFFAFVTDIGPQAVPLTAADAIIGHQHGFKLADLCRRFAEPGQNRIFLMAGRARHTTDPIALGEERQRFDDVTRRGLASIKQSPFRRHERVVTGPTLIALLSVVSSTKLDNVPCRCRLRFPVISAVRIGTEIARLDQL